MRRNAASGRSETPAELIARLTAEHGPSSALPAAPVRGRRRRRAETGTAPSAVATVERAGAVDGDTDAGDVDTGPVAVTGDVDDSTPLFGTELISGSSPSRGEDDPDPPTAGVSTIGPDGHRHRRPRTATRRFAPLAAGAAVVLVASTVAIVVSTQDRSVAAPDLSTVIQEERTTTAPPPTTTLPVPTTTVPVPTVAPVAAPPPPAPKPPPPPAPKKKEPAAGDGTQAAVKQGWTRVGGDEFNGSSYSDAWDAYEGPGHGGNGRRTRDAISVGDGVMTITGDSDGNTGGLAWKDSQRFGKWEMRAKFPAGDEQYHPVLLLWPNGEWPEGGEVDFAETTSASDQVSFFLHYSSENKQKYAHKKLDITQWHNYAVEWVDGRITGYIDGEKWFESTDRSTLPPDKMFAVIQLDWFPEGGSPRESKLHVDYVRIYE